MIPNTNICILMDQWHRHNATLPHTCWKAFCHLLYDRL